METPKAFANPFSCFLSNVRLIPILISDNTLLLTPDEAANAVSDNLCCFLNSSIRNSIK